MTFSIVDSTENNIETDRENNDQNIVLTEVIIFCLFENRISSNSDRKSEILLYYKNNISIMYNGNFFSKVTLFIHFLFFFNG